MQYPALTQHVEVGREPSKQSRKADVESYPEVDGAVYRSGVYKMPMTRMWLTTTDESPNVWVKKNKW